MTWRVLDEREHRGRAAPRRGRPRRAAAPAGPRPAGRRRAARRAAAGRAHPAPGGAYPPPPGYGTTPPASPYGQPAGQPYGQQPYGQPYAPAPGQVDIGNGFSWAFSKFGQNWVTFLVGTLLWFIGISVVTSLVSGIFGGFGSLIGRDGSGVGAGFALASAGIAGAVVTAVTILLGSLFSAAVIGTALKVTAGRPVSLADMFDFSHVAQVFVLGLLLAVANGVLTFIPFFGALAQIAITYFVFFGYHLIVDRNLGAIDAIRESVQLQTRNVGSSVLVVLVAIAIVVVGIIACFVGVLVAGPVAALFSAYAYRRVTNGQIAA
ncbi:hypothetical protein [Cellulomonas sp. FA1]|uniref:hypothetical protein n=1 Tax=Cellulomonas sp. FA1 TaxID=1346710 RepID=UPI000B048601|nr:hypothetical protein [Cellulomonas sp. FA1]